MNINRNLFGDVDFSFLSRVNHAREPEKNPKQEFVDKINRIISTNLITLAEGREWRVTPIYGAKGQHSQVYTIDADQAEIYRGVENVDLLFKTFHLEPIEMGDKPEKQVYSYVKTSLMQYSDLVKEGFPTAKIYNSETVFADGGYLVERVTPLTQVGNERKTSLEVREEILRLFLKSGTRPDTVAVDLSPQNVGFNQEGKLVLFDYMEHDDEIDDAFLLCVRKFLEQFKNECGNEFYEFLLEGIRTADDQRIQDRLDLCEGRSKKAKIA